MTHFFPPSDRQPYESWDAHQLSLEQRQASESRFVEVDDNELAHELAREQGFPVHGDNFVVVSWRLVPTTQTRWLPGWWLPVMWRRINTGADE